MYYENKNGGSKWAPLQKQATQKMIAAQRQNNIKRFGVGHAGLGRYVKRQRYLLMQQNNSRKEGKNL